MEKKIGNQTIFIGLTFNLKNTLLELLICEETIMQEIPEFFYTFINKNVF